MVCKNCGETLAEGSKFCHKCGSVIANDVIEAALNIEPVVETNKESFVADEYIPVENTKGEKAINILLVIFNSCAAIVAFIFFWICFSRHYIVPCAISLAQMVMLTMSFLMAIKKMEESSKNIRIALAVIAMIAFIPFGITMANQHEHFSWDSELCQMIPAPPINAGEFYSNNENYLNAELVKVSDKEYSDYIQKCKDMGYTIEMGMGDTWYTAYNDDGYYLSVYRNKKGMSISLDGPRKLSSSFTWPTIGIASVLPDPKVKKGEISWENEEEFAAHVAMTKDRFESYVQECIDAGFIEDYTKYDEYFEAEKDGIGLLIQYDGNGIVYISVES